MQKILPFFLLGFVAAQLHRHLAVSHARSLVESNFRHADPEVVYFSHYINFAETGSADVCDCSAIAALGLNCQDNRGLYYFEKARSLCGCTDVHPSHNPDFKRFVHVRFIALSESTF